MRSRGLSAPAGGTPTAGVAGLRRAVSAVAAGATAFVLTWLLVPTTALAHTDIISTRPGDREVLTEPVARIELEFSGALDTAETSVRVLDADADEVPAETIHPSDSLVLVEPERDLDSGRYAVLWSVRSSSDGHEISGSFSFAVATIGTAATAPAATTVGIDAVTAPVAEDAVASSLVEWLGRWVAMAGAIVGVGAIGFAATSLVGTAAEVRRAAAWIRFGGILVLAGSVVEVVALATSHGHSLAAALMPWTWIDVLPTAQAYAMVLRIAGGIAMLQSPRLVPTSPGPPISDPLRSEDMAASGETGGSAVATAARADTGRNRLEIQHEWVTIAGAVMVIVSFGLDGHTADAGLIGRLAAMTHVLAAGIWAGGLVVMADLLLRRRRSSRPTEAAAVTVRFSRVASAALVLTAIAGGVLAWSLVDEPAELWSGSWGRTLGVKLALVVVAAAIGAYNHFRVVPHLDASRTHASATLRRTVTAESVLIIAVLAVTAVLVTAAP